MSIHVKIIVPAQELPATALLHLQTELGEPLSVLERKIAASEPLVDRMPPHHLLEEFVTSTIRLVHTLDSLGVAYLAWVNDEPVSPQHLRTTLTHKLHVLKSLHEGRERPKRASLEED